MSRMQIARLENGRLHLHDGPIDLIIACDGRAEEIARAETAAIERFATILDELCRELVLLRTPTHQMPQGKVARRMWSATRAFSETSFITPMAAVAGSVAEEILETMLAAAHLTRAMVNNGGDIAIHLIPGQLYRVGLIDRPDLPSIFASSEITSAEDVRGIATSGWRGRSFSLGIADAVTVLASRASIADAAATMIANAVDLPGHPAITRRPANKLQPDSDLKDRLVTTDVGLLDKAEIVTALSKGTEFAQELLDARVISASALNLAGETLTLSDRSYSKIGSYAYA